jgi:hypothetical protein
MAFEVIDSEIQAVRTIRSYLGTLQRYRATSMAVHNAQIVSAYQLASDLGIRVHDLGSTFQHSAEVQRWVRKFDEFVKQYNLVTEKQGETKHGEGNTKK